MGNQNNQHKYYLYSDFTLFSITPYYEDEDDCNIDLVEMQAI